MYYELTPENWAAQYIEAYWTYSNNTSKRIKAIIPPDGCTDIILSFNNGRCNQFVVGCMTRPAEVFIEPAEISIGIRFRPCCASPFLNIPLIELTDKNIPLDEICELNIPAIDADCVSNKNFIFSAIENKLKKCFMEKQFDKIAYSAAVLIKDNNGLRTVDEIADIIGVSRRHLERKFMNSVGISPKFYSRITRFQYVNKILKVNIEDSLASIAQNAGYYDQSHFYKEYKMLSGTVPLKKQ